MSFPYRGKEAVFKFSGPIRRLWHMGNENTLRQSAASARRVCASHFGRSGLKDRHLQRQPQEATMDIIMRSRFPAPLLLLPA